MERLFSEEDIRDYCQHHPLSRPKVSIIEILMVVILTEMTMLAIAWLLENMYALDYFLCVKWLNYIVLLVFAKYIIKTAVKIYQSRASEETRRKCHCMPSCSEYALLALDKYIWPKALWIIYKRLMYTCTKPGYKIDFP